MLILAGRAAEIAFGDDGGETIVAVTKQEKLLCSAGSHILAYHRGDLICAGGGRLPRGGGGAVSVAVIAIVQRIAVGVFCLGQVTVCENLCVSHIIRHGIAGAAAGDFQAQTVFVIIRAGDIAEIMLRTVGIIVNKICCVADAQRGHSLLQRQLPADADEHIVIVLCVDIQIAAGEVAARQGRVVDQGKREGHHIAGRRKQRHDQGVLQGEVIDVGCACSANPHGLIGVLRLNAARAAIEDRHSRTVRGFLRAVKAHTGGKVCLVQRLKHKAAIIYPILTVIPLERQCGNIPSHIFAGRCRGNRL